MAQGQFTKEEGAETIISVNEIFATLSKPKKMQFFGHLNDIMLYLEAAIKAAPSQQTKSDG